MRPRRRKSPWARKPTQQPCCSSSVPSALLSFVQQRLPVIRVAVTEATHSNGGYRLFLTTLETLNGVFFNLKTLRTPLPTGYPSAKNTPLPSLSSSLASIGDGSPTRAESLVFVFQYTHRTLYSQHPRAPECSKCHQCLHFCSAYTSFPA